MQEPTTTFRSLSAFTGAMGARRAVRREPTGRAARGRPAIWRVHRAWTIVLVVSAGVEGGWQVLEALEVGFGIKYIRGKKLPTLTSLELPQQQGRGEGHAHTPKSVLPTHTHTHTPVASGTVSPH